jgi:hypothetical protein
MAMSQMWELSVTILRPNLSSRTVRHSRGLAEAEMVLVYTDSDHYMATSELSLSVWIQCLDAASK